jgi:hypothetical protein
MPDLLTAKRIIQKHRLDLTRLTVERDASGECLESGLFEVWVERERRGKIELLHENE